MKLWAISLLIVMFFTGCSPASEIERGMALRSALLQAQACSFDADIRADYGEKTHSFSMSCQFDSAGNMTFSVLEPDSISGITGKITEEGGALTFDDTVLHFDLMADEQISPISAPWILMKTLRGGYLTATGTESDKLLLSIDDSYEEDALHLDIWLGVEDLPERAEILYDGRRILTVTVKNFRIS